MTYVLSIISEPRARLVSDALVEKARSALTSCAAKVGETRFLDPDIAADIHFEAPETDTVAETVRHALRDEAVDINTVAEKGRRKSLLIADMDSTIIVGESLDDLSEFAGLKDMIAPITERAMRGEIGFEDALRERVAMLQGLPLTKVNELLAQTRIMPGAEILVRTMVRNGAFCALVSGGFTLVTSVIREKVGFHEDRSNILLHRDGFLTGEVNEPILGKDAKLAALKEFCTAHELNLEQTIAVGDGANDIPMLSNAGIGVAYRGKPLVKQAAPQRLDHGDLTGLLYLQGYRENEIG